MTQGENSNSLAADSRTIGVAVVGLGVGEEHARFLTTLPQARLACVYDIDASRARSVADRFSISPAESYQAVLEMPGVDMVIVASYDHDHFQQVTAALEAGKHVFAEKPLCQTLSELQSIKKTWMLVGTAHLGSNLVLRTAPLYMWLRDFIGQGGLGEIYAFDGDYLYGRIEKILTGWRRDSPGYTGLKGGGIHLIDIMHWVTRQKPSSVFATGNRISTSESSFPSDDYIAATYRFPSGMIGRITVNLGSVHRHHHIVRIFGTLGTFIYDDAGPRLHLTRDASARATAVALDPLPVSKGALLPRFLDRILGGNPDQGATQEQIDSMSMCLAAEESLARGSAVPIQYM